MLRSYGVVLSLSNQYFEAFKNNLKHILSYTEKIYEVDL
jgi:hypothetical protein